MKYWSFIFFLVQTSKTVFHFIIVQDYKNSISSYEPIFCKNIVSVCDIVLVNFLFKNIFLYLFAWIFLYCDTLKKNTPQP